MDEITRRLDDAEGSGRVEYKRSCLWPLDKSSLDVQGVLMRLANANPEVGGLVHLGREDNGTVRGLVDKDLLAVTTQQLKASEQKLVQVAAKLDPPMHLRWFMHEMDGVSTIVVEVPGRPRGGWYQDENGVAKIGSAGHPIIVRQALLQTWAGEINEALHRLEVTTTMNTMAVVMGDRTSETHQIITVAVRNFGSATEYVEHVGFHFDFGGHQETVSFFSPLGDTVTQFSAKLHTPLEPGNKQEFKYPLAKVAKSFQDQPSPYQQRATIHWREFSLLEVVVTDALGNSYREAVSEAVRDGFSRALHDVPEKLTKR